ncbi:helix-turn-helix domain-containing protein [Actinocrispum wychmicini]|uniref:PucR-like helix-turn-helix protein n=1 Tax=Actinocrispum wychmicini TaxID=1213861 RepID=A0A4R2JA24_9PSEU|nr:helix-turn-helix domain-containing protein [Actinocrispum wychmicini]TCO55127.1 PucR-like helix-turn-helix protein [Actinocrispum wychmicini]
MTVDVRRILTLPEWADSVRVLGGATGTARPVRSVRPMLTPGDDRPVAAGELAVVTEPVAPTDWRIDTLLRRIADADGAGVLISAPGEPLRSTLLLADRLGVPLLVTTAVPLDLVIAARLLLASPDLDRATLVLAVHGRLSGRLRPPDVVVSTLRALLRAPVALLDDRGEPLAGEVSDTTGLRLERVVPQRVPLDDGVLLAHPAGRPALWLATELRGDAAARADVVPPALAVGSDAVERWLLTNRIDRERDARARSALLGDLLRLDGEPSADLRARVANEGWRLGGWHVGIRIGARPGVDVLTREPDVGRALRAEGIDAAVVEHGDGWTAWSTFNQEPTAAQVHDVAARLRAAQRRLRDTVSAYMGVGRPHPRPEGLASTVAEATDAAKLAATRPESGHFLHVDQLGMAQLLLEWTRTDTFEPAARALLAPLRGQPGDLVRTLAVYLDAESSITETAAALGVHRNTVSARIERVEGLLGVDLTQRDERLALHLACRVAG